MSDLFFDERVKREIDEFEEHREERNIP